MARQEEISSTERLLEVIRNKNKKDTDSPDIRPPTSIPSGLTASINKLIPFRKKTTVGVDIGSDSLKMAAISYVSEKKMELIDYTVIPFEPELSKDSPDFPRFLRSALTRFCDSAKPAEIWCAISSVSVETRYVKIPKVPPKQIPNAVYWTYKKEVSFNEQSNLFDFDVLGDITEEGVRRIEVICYSAPMNEIQGIRNLFSKSGYPLTGISIVPFAVQNLFRTGWIDAGEKHLCNLFIGKDWSRIAIFSDGNLILSRDIKSGLISMIEAVREEIGHISALPSKESTDAENVAKSSYYDTDLASKIFRDFIQDSSAITPEEEKPDYKEDEIFDMILPVLDRIVRQVERTIEHYTLHFKRETAGKIFVSGKVCANRRIVDYIGDHLDLHIDVIDPFVSDSSFLGDSAGPESATERGVFVPAIGMALSSNSLTPNFINTYKDKQKLATTLRVNRLVFGAIVLIMTLSVGFNYSQEYFIKLKKNQQSQLQRQADSYVPYVDQGLIVQMVAQKQQGVQTLKKLGRRYMGIAVISEVSKITPEHIRLLGMTVELGKGPANKAIGQKESDNKKKLLILEGIIFGDRLNFDALLANYLVKLKNSPVFGQTKIQKKSVDSFEDKEVLRFTARLDLV